MKRINQMKNFNNIELFGYVLKEILQSTLKRTPDTFFSLEQIILK